MSPFRPLRPRTSRLRPVRLLKLDGVYRADNIDRLISQWREPYRLMLKVPWPGFLLLIALAYLGTNVVFALLYLLDAPGIGGLRQGQVAGFSDAFFFSVQTLGSIGYGVLHPVSPLVNGLVTLQAFVSLVFTAMTTGLVFARFSRSRAEIRFSKVATVQPWDGRPCLTFRIANVHHNNLVSAQVQAYLAIDERSAEGETMRSLHRLELVRSEAFLFQLMWTVMHPIGPDSPLHGLGEAQLRAAHGEVLVAFEGLDETVRSPVYKRAAYNSSRIRFDETFVDIVRDDQSEFRCLDFSRFNDTRQL